MPSRAMADAATLVLRAAASATSSAAASASTAAASHGRPSTYKPIGISLAVASGFFIGVSFVFKKKGLLASTAKSGKEAGEGMDYLKNAWWWTGMTLMILGEICNFVAYGFVEAILVTPLGALSVVISAILSSIFLKERLSFVGKIGCFMCIVGSIVIVMNAPEQSSVDTIQEMQHFVVAPGFLTYAGVIIVSCVGIALWVAPRYGNKTMMVYITICSLIGGLSVVATQGLGAAIITQIGGTPQFNQWFLYVLLVFVVITLVTEIIYLNKALNIFNTALVTPTYYVFFTASTIVTSAILFRGFKGTPTSIVTVVMGFLVICSGVVLLQLSKSAKDVPDTEVFRGDFDQVRIVAEQSEPESEPKADAIRGAAAIIRRISVARRQAEEDEARKVREEKLLDFAGNRNDSDGEIVWDGVRRRTVTWGPEAAAKRRATLSAQHAPRSLARIPDIEEGGEPSDFGRSDSRRRSMSVDEAMRQQVYPNAEVPGLPAVGEDSEYPDGFYGRVKSFFIPKTRSRQSLRSEAQDLSAVLPHHRDVRDASAAGGPTRARGYTNPNTEREATAFGVSTEYRPYSSPENNSLGTEMRHVSFTKSTSPLSASSSEYGMVPLSHSPPLPSPSLYPTALTSPPLHSLSPPGSTPSSGASNLAVHSTSRPDSRSSARRQFSFQNILHPRGHGHSRERSVGSDLLGRRRESHKTEEEMLGLVKGDVDENDSNGTDTESESGSEDALGKSKSKSVRVSERESVGSGGSESEGSWDKVKDTNI